MGAEPHRVTLYGRPGCHLCEVARDVILQVRRRHPFAFDEVDIEPNEALVRHYGFRVPVVEVDGREAFEIDVDPRELAALVGDPAS
jgi:glutaredoxin